MPSTQSLASRSVLLPVLLLFFCTAANDQTPPQAGPDRPEPILQVGHRRAVHAVAFSPDGRWVATGAKDNTIKIWDVATGRLLRTLYGHGSPVTALSVSPDGSLLASASGNSYDVRYAKLFFKGGQIGGLEEDASVRIWDVRSGRQLQVLRGHGLAVLAVAFGADGKSVTSASSDAIKVWDASTGKELRSMRVFPLPKRGSGMSLGGALTGTAKDTSLEKWQKTFKDLAGEILISSTGEVVAEGQPGKKFQLFDTVHMRKLNAVDAVSAPEAPGALAFQKDGQLVAYVRQDKEVAVQSLGKNKDLWRAALPAAGGAFLCMSADGQILAAESPNGNQRTVQLWSSSNGKSLGQFTIPDDRVSRVVAFSPDGKSLAMAPRGGHSVELRSIARGDVLRVFGTAGPPEQFSPVDPQLQKLLTSLGLARSGELAEASEDVGDFSATYRGGETVTFTLDGRWLLIKRGLQSGLSTTAWDISTGTQLQDASSPQFKQVGIPYHSPEGRFDTKPAYSSERPNGLQRSLGLSFKERGAGAQRVTLKDARDGHKLHEFNEGMAREAGTIPATGFSLDGAQIAVTGFKTRQYIPEVFVFDTKTGKKLAEFNPNETQESGPVFSLAISRDTRAAALGYGTRDVQIVDAHDGKPAFRLSHLGGTAGLSFNPDGRLLAVLGKDGDCYLFDAHSGQLLATLVSNGSDWLVVAPDGKFDGSPAAWSQILWRFNGNTFNVAPVETFFNEFYYPGLLSEIIAGKRLRATRDLTQLDRRQPSLELEAEGISGAAVNSRNVKVRIKVAEAKPDQDHKQGSTVRDVRLFRNGSLVNRWQGDQDLDRDGKAILEATIPIVAGSNHFVAYAFNQDNIKSSDASLILTGAPSLKRSGTAYVLTVGIDEYSNPEYSLKFAVADAQDVSNELKVQQTKIGASSKVEVVPLLNSEATKKNVLLAVRRLAGTETGPLPAGAPQVLEKLNPAQPEDEVFIYFAGHGAATDQRFFLIPHDLGYAGSRTELDPAGWLSIQDHSISDLELEDALEKVDARDVILIIDACNSGQALEAEERRRGPMNSRGLAQLAYEKGMYVLTAAQGYQAALEVKELGHGLLTYALVEEGLKTPAADKAPKDGKIVAREWIDYATVRVPELQEAQMEAAQKQGRSISFVEGPVETENDARGDAKSRGLQRPRVFYRREVDPDPIVIAKP